MTSNGTKVNCTTPQLDFNFTPLQFELNHVIQTLAWADKAYVFSTVFPVSVSFFLSHQPLTVCVMLPLKAGSLCTASDDRKIGPVSTLNQRCPKLKHWLCRRREWEVFIQEEGTIEPRNESHAEKRGTSWLSEKQCHSALWAEIVYSYFKG